MLEHLRPVSYTHLKEQNPVDLEAEKDKLVSRLAPYFKNLQDAITAKDPVSYTHLDVYKRQRHLLLPGSLKRSQCSLHYSP